MGRAGADPLTSAELSAEQKNAISHRGKAFRALVPDIEELLG
jgi:XTP/dITP diphosphohydrolase